LKYEKECIFGAVETEPDDPGGVSVSELRLTVVRVQDVAPAVKCLTLRGAGAVELPDFSAGAHINVTLPDGDERSYSLVDLGRRVANEYQLAVRLDEDGTGGSRFMHGLQAGDVVTCQPPQNDFPLRSSDKPPLLIAGGIGVTPITGMLAALKGKGFDFHYAGRAADALAFVPELRELAAAQMHLHFDGTDSALDLDAIFQGFESMRPVYVCGPKGMIEAVKAAKSLKNFYQNTVHC